MIIILLTIAIFTAAFVQLRRMAKAERAAEELRIRRTNAALKNAHAHHMAESTGHPAGRALRNQHDIDRGRQFE